MRLFCTLITFTALYAQDNDIEVIVSRNMFNLSLHFDLDLRMLLRSCYMYIIIAAK